MLVKPDDLLPMDGLQNSLKHKKIKTSDEFDLKTPFQVYSQVKELAVVAGESADSNEESGERKVKTLHLIITRKLKTDNEENQSWWELFLNSSAMSKILTDNQIVSGPKDCMAALAKVFEEGDLELDGIAPIRRRKDTSSQKPKVQPEISLGIMYARKMVKLYPFVRFQPNAITANDLSVFSVKRAEVLQLAKKESQKLSVALEIEKASNRKLKDENEDLLKKLGENPLAQKAFHYISPTKPRVKRPGDTLGTMQSKKVLPSNCVIVKEKVDKDGFIDSDSE